MADENESVEMGTTKYTVLDDREGHIPLVTNSQVESYIRYFQGKGRKGFNIWLKRYVRCWRFIRSSPYLRCNGRT